MKRGTSDSKRKLILTDEDRKQAEADRERKRSYWAKASVLESMLPESNRLSNYAHNAEEEERLGEAEQDKYRRSLFQ